MTKYLISFPSDAMQLREDEFAAVGADAHAVIQEAKDASVYVFSGGLNASVPAVTIAADRSVSDETYAQTRGLDGGWCVLELPSRDAAIEWSAKLARACRCAQELREFMFDPDA